jgi:hypothetical protein
MGLLTANYPPRGGSADAADALLAAWWAVLGPLRGDGSYPGRWLTLPIFERAVQEALKTVSDYLPTVGAFVHVCEYVKLEQEREGRQALPPPDEVALSALPQGRYDLAKWDRNAAIGRARQRNRLRLMAEWRRAQGAAGAPPSVGHPPAFAPAEVRPTDEQVGGALRQLASLGRLKGSLEGALAVRVPIDAGLEQEGP